MNSKWTYSDINNMALAPQEFVDSCAERYRSRVKEAAEIVFNDIDKKIVMLAGPSSSGKTTTASLISAQIELMGGRAYSVSLDDSIAPMTSRTRSMTRASRIMRASRRWISRCCGAASASWRLRARAICPCLISQAGSSATVRSI